MDEQPQDCHEDVRSVSDDDGGGGGRIAAHGPPSDTAVRAETQRRRSDSGQRSAGRAGRRARPEGRTVLGGRRPRPRAEHPVRVFGRFGRAAAVRGVSADRGQRRLRRVGRRGDAAHVRRVVPLRVAVRTRLSRRSRTGDRRRATAVER